MKSKACFTAAAPISPDVLLYFGSLDIPIYEVFGQSECTGPHTVSSAGNWIIGACGRPIRGSETMIAPGTGEVKKKHTHTYKFLSILMNLKTTLVTYNTYILYYILTCM